MIFLLNSEEIGEVKLMIAEFVKNCNLNDIQLKTLLDLIVS